ncbi:MAG: hypothetical protein BWZ09_02808 [Alphaproteobacteria bacterium ADurb.BinA305]|nr:MAG: hypothetical protein BWZ09_02808 [Alphaproteobacteria bacterium ADurb.BinA305]
MARGAFPRQALDDVGADLLHFRERQQVGLVQHQPALARGQRRAEAFELTLDGAHGLDRIRTVERRHVHQVQQQARARQVLEETDAEARAFRGALDQPGNVGDHEAAVLPHAHHAEVRHQRREGVVGDLGFRGRDRADESRLARIGHAEQAHVGQYLQLETQRARLALGARGALARRAVGARLVARVAETMETALRHQQALAGPGQVADDLAGVLVEHRGAHRDRQHQVVAALAGAVGARARLAAVGAKVPRVAVVDHGVQRDVGLEENAAAVTAVAAVGAAEGHVLLAAKAHAAVAALARLHLDGRFVYEFHKQKPRR